MSHVRYHGVHSWNDVTVDWLSVSMLSGTFSTPGARMRARDLVFPLFTAGRE